MEGNSVVGLHSQCGEAELVLYPVAIRRKGRPKKNQKKKHHHTREFSKAALRDEEKLSRENVPLEAVALSHNVVHP